MTLGFTGTQIGMTQRQQATVRYLFLELVLHELHHGDCVGADAQAHKIAQSFLCARIVLHPPSDPKLRAYSEGADEVRPEKPYLARNRHIVAAGCDGLVAAPRDTVERLRGSGTWATIRYARKAKRHIWIVWPDGTFKEEHA